MQTEVRCVFCDWVSIEEQIVKTIPEFYIINCKGALTPGHRLIIPYRHIRDLSELRVFEWRQLQYGVNWVIKQNWKEFKRDSFTFINAPSGQSVYHLHWHLVPNFFGEHGLDKALRAGWPGAEKVPLDRFKK